MTRLFVRIETKSGPRTIITGPVSPRDASEISEALMECGMETVITEALHIPIKQLMRRKKMAEKVQISPPTNVAEFKKPARPR